MAQKLILINGLGGAGKTEVGRGLLIALPSSALVDFDALTCVNPFEYADSLFELGHKNAAVVTENFYHAQYCHVIMCGGCGTQRQLDQFLSLLPERPEILWFFLATSSEERRRRKVSRGRDDSDKPEWFDFLEAKVGPYEGLVTGSRVRAFEIRTDGKALNQVVLELKVIVEHNAGEQSHPADAQARG
jgi:hypothetical protein